MRQYITKKYEYWDEIALKMYGNEYFASFLQENNLKLLDIFSFDEGIIVNIPDLSSSKIESNMPAWRKNDI